MTINGVEVTKAYDGDAQVGVDAATGYFVKIGYEMRSHEAGRAHLKFSGTWFSTDADKHTHHVYVSGKPGALVFEFTTGIVASYWTEKDRAFAEERAEAALAAARAFGKEGEGGYRTPADDASMLGCRYCGKINLRTLPACTCCGAAVPR